jgi:hypothetical protein
MGDNRKNYCNSKSKLLNNKGIALITTIIIIAAILIISGAMLYLITRGIRSTGEFQRFETVQAAAEGGIDIATYILENFEDTFYSLEQENRNFHMDRDNITLPLKGTYTDDITFHRIDECKIISDNASKNGAYLDRYLIGMTPDENNYEECQKTVWEKPFITITPQRGKNYNPPYEKIDIFIRKELQGPTPGAGDSASLTAPYTGNSAGYLLSILSYATHYKTKDNSTVEMLYYLQK